MNKPIHMADVHRKAKRDKTAARIKAKRMARLARRKNRK